MVERTTEPAGRRGDRERYGSSYRGDPRNEEDLSRRESSKHVASLSMLVPSFKRGASRQDVCLPRRLPPCSFDSAELGGLPGGRRLRVTIS
jgi:hypothetical protein